MAQGRIFLINLDRQPERLAFMTGQFAASDLRFERMSAVDGNAADGLRDASVLSYAPLSRSEIGCFESHLGVWRRVVDEGLSHATVLEDDCLLASDFPQILDALPDPLHFDVIKLDQWLPAVKTAEPERRLTSGRVLRRLADRDVGAAGYVVSQAGARKLVAASRRYFIPVDRLMFNPREKLFRRLTILKLLPPAVAQTRRAGDSGEADPFKSGIVRGGLVPLRGLDLFRLRLRRLWLRDTRRHRVARMRQLDASSGQDVRVNTVLYDPGPG